MKQLFWAIVATGLIFATSCKKEEVRPIGTTTSTEFNEQDWILLQKNYKEDGMVGDLLQSKYDKNQTLFNVREMSTRALPGLVGTYSKKIIHPDPLDPTILAVVHICDGKPTDCYFDSNGNLVHIQSMLHKK